MEFRLVLTCLLLSIHLHAGKSQSSSYDSGKLHSLHTLHQIKYERSLLLLVNQLYTLITPKKKEKKKQETFS